MSNPKEVLSIGASGTKCERCGESPTLMGFSGESREGFPESFDICYDCLYTILANKERPRWKISR